MQWNEFKILFPTQSLKNNIFSVNFRIVCQTPNKTIERQCKEKWPYLMQANLLSMDQLREFRKMEKFIEERITKPFLDDILDFFYKDRWLHPFTKSDGLASISLHKFNCKLWEIETPFLELEGTLTLNLKAVILLYFDKYIKMDKDKHILRTSVEISFNKPWPEIITHRGISNLNDIVIGILKEKLFKSNDSLGVKIKNLFDIKNLSNEKMQFVWTTNKSINIEISTASSFLKNIAKVAIPGYLAYKFLK